MKNSRLGIKKRLALKLHSHLVKNWSRQPELNYLFWECTLRCNLACLHCGSDCQRSNTISDMPLHDFLKAIDELTPHVNPNRITVGLTGGEPLLRKDMEACGKELYRRGYPWGFVTNGVLLSEKRLGTLLDAGLRAVTVSFDGLKENHQWLRGTSEGFEKTARAIELIAAAPELVYDVVTCVNQRNLNELPAIKDFLLQRGVKQWRLFTIFPVGRARQYPELQLSDREFVQLMEFIKATRREGAIGASYGCEGYLGAYEGEVRDHFFYCKAGINVASVLHDGSISACPSLRNNFIQGNIYHDNFWEVWQNRYAVMRDRHWAKTGPCAGCESYAFCLGNGLHLRDQHTQELLVCHLAKVKNGAVS